MEMSLEESTMGKWQLVYFEQVEVEVHNEYIREDIQ